MLYTSQAVPPPIIRSSKLYTQHRVFVELFLLLTAIVSELELVSWVKLYEGWNFNSGNYLFTTDTE